MMAALAPYLAHIITGIAVFAAIFLHWRKPKRYWQPSLFAAAITSIAAYLAFSLLPQAQEPKLVHSVANISKIMGFAFISSFVVAMLIGYLMKFAPSLFKS